MLLLSACGQAAPLRLLGLGLPTCLLAQHADTTPMAPFPAGHGAQLLPSADRQAHLQGADWSGVQLAAARPAALPCCAGLPCPHHPMGSLHPRGWQLRRLLSRPTDLHPGGQLGPDGWVPRCCGHLPDLHSAGLRLWCAAPRCCAGRSALPWPGCQLCPGMGGPGPGVRLGFPACHTLEAPAFSSGAELGVCCCCCCGGCGGGRHAAPTVLACRSRRAVGPRLVWRSAHWIVPHASL